MNYDNWLKSIPLEMTKDPLWKLQAYRTGVFMVDLGWHDVTKLSQDKRTRGVSDQLYRAMGSIGANISEGYARGGGKDRVRFYEYALGSARESRNWYYAARHILGDLVAGHRMRLATQIIRLLLAMIPAEREIYLREDSIPYQIPADSTPDELSDLLTNVPIPEFTQSAARSTS